MEKIRLQKYFSECGIMSRRAAEKAITDKRVTVNGKLAKLGDCIDPKTDKVCLDGESVVRESEECSYYMLHKPRGFVTTMQDEKGRRCVADLVADIPERVFPVGRLDLNSEGMLLMTNDGDFANALMQAFIYGI